MLLAQVVFSHVTEAPPPSVTRITFVVRLGDPLVMDGQDLFIRGQGFIPLGSTIRCQPGGRERASS